MFWEKELSLLAYSVLQVLAQMLMCAPGGGSALQARHCGGKGTKNLTSIQSTEQPSKKPTNQPTINTTKSSTQPSNQPTNQPNNQTINPTNQPNHQPN
jgi:hypothetical protein